jgi:hypothetical protein
MRMSLQCVSRSVGIVIPFVVICIQSDHMLYTVTAALLQTASRTADEGGVSELLAGRTSSSFMIRHSATPALGQQNSPDCFSNSVEPSRYPSVASSAKSLIRTAQPRPKQVDR